MSDGQVFSSRGGQQPVNASLMNYSAVAATGGPGGPWPPHFLLRWNLRICILLFFVSMYLWIFVHNLRYKGLFLGVSKALWDAQFYLSSKHSGADLKFYRISGPPTQILAPRPLVLECVIGNCFTATMHTIAQTTVFTTECHETVQKWKYLIT